MKDSDGQERLDNREMKNIHSIRKVPSFDLTFTNRKEKADAHHEKRDADHPKEHPIREKKCRVASKSNHPEHSSMLRKPSIIVIDQRAKRKEAKLRW
jgi:hypothetical protein